jgi:hypothetical protein
VSEYVRKIDVYVRELVSRPAAVTDGDLVGAYIGGSYALGPSGRTAPLANALEAGHAGTYLDAAAVLEFLRRVTRTFERVMAK